MYDNVMNKFRWGGIERKKTLEHTIKSEETKAAIAERFGLNEYELEQQNPSITEFKAGEKLKIIVPDDIYLDENILRMTMNLRSNYARLVEALINGGKKDKALLALDRCMEVMPRQLVPYNIFIIRFPELYYKLGQKEKAASIIRDLANVYEQEMKYYVDVADYDPASKRNSQQAYAVMQELLRLATNYGDKELQEELKAKFTSMQTTIQQIKPS